MQPQVRVGLRDTAARGEDIRRQVQDREAQHDPQDDWEERRPASHAVDPLIPDAVVITVRAYLCQVQRQVPEAGGQRRNSPIRVAVQLRRPQVQVRRDPDDDLQLQEQVDEGGAHLRHLHDTSLKGPLRHLPARHRERRPRPSQPVKRTQEGHRPFHGRWRPHATTAAGPVTERLNREVPGVPGTSAGIVEALFDLRPDSVGSFLQGLGNLLNGRRERRRVPVPAQRQTGDRAGLKPTPHHQGLVVGQPEVTPHEDPRVGHLNDRRITQRRRRLKKDIITLHPLIRCGMHAFLDP